LNSSTAKKVLLERFDRVRIQGYVQPNGYLQPGGVELLSLDGTVALIPFEQIKAVCFVRDLDGQPLFSERREFFARPKAHGLWVELLFRDGDRLEGILPHNLLEVEPGGYVVTPPEIAGNTQRVFVPRQALRQLNVLGVVGGKKRHLARAPETRQIRLFGEEETAAERTR
jgi:hypothetical protein